MWDNEERTMTNLWNAIRQISIVIVGYLILAALLVLTIMLIQV